MSWKTLWVDDDVVAESDDGTTRVVLQPDMDAELDGCSYPILVNVDYRRNSVESCTGQRWYHPDTAVNGDDDAFARAVDHFYLGLRTWRRDGTVERPDYMNLLTRWVRLYLGGTHVARLDYQGETYFACDSAALREIWGVPSGTTLTDESLLLDIPEFLAGETYGYVVQERLCADCDDHEHIWVDTDESLWGLIGREWAEDSAREALDEYTRA